MVIIVVAIIIVVAGLANYFPQAWAKLQEMIGWGGFGNDLQNAIKCSYYRCMEGCQSSKIANSVFNTGPEGDKNCKKDFCDPSWTDNGKDDGRICGWNAQQFPVEVAATEDMEVSKSGLNIGLNCIVPTDATTNSNFNFINMLLSSNPVGYILDLLLNNFLNRFTNWLIIDHSDIDTAERIPCDVGSTKISDTAEKFSLKGDYYYIVTGSSRIGVLGIDFLGVDATYIDNIKPYIFLELDKPLPPKEFDENKYRVVLQSQKDPKDMLEYYIKVEGIHETPSDKYATVTIGGEGSIEDGRELSVLDSPDFYYQIEKIVRPDRIDYNYLHVKLKDVTIGYRAVLEVEFTSFMPGGSSAG